MEVQPDFRDLLALFNEHEVEYLIVGGYALAFHGAPRFTGDIDIFVRPDGTYIGVDFGIVGTLTTADQRYLAENLLAFFHRAYRKVAGLHVESGWVPSHAMGTTYKGHSKAAPVRTALLSSRKVISCIRALR